MFLITEKTMNTTSKTIGIIATFAMVVGGIVALLFAILNFQYARYIMNLLYGVILIIVVVATIALIALYNTKFSGQQEKYGFYFAIMPIWLIEAGSLLAVDYAYIGSNATLLATFIISLIILATGGIGFNLIARGRFIPGRVFSLIFLILELVGTVLSFPAAASLPAASLALSVSVWGNILRIVTVISLTVVLFMTKDVTAQPVDRRDAVSEPKPMQTRYESESAVEQAAPEPAPVTRIESPIEKKETAPTFIVQEPKQSMREKLVEAKQLYEEGLISDEEYTILKRRAIDS